MNYSSGNKSVEYSKIKINDVYWIDVQSWFGDVLYYLRKEKEYIEALRWIVRAKGQSTPFKETKFMGLESGGESGQIKTKEQFMRHIFDNHPAVFEFLLWHPELL